MLKLLGIGAQKCGTTWLHNTLARHPLIGFPGGKEVHYWNRPGERSPESYLAMFDGSRPVQGDITPAYGILPVETIRSIHSLLPHVRLIYLIRDPIERAWSAARMALERAELQHAEASDQWFIDHFRSRSSMARGDYETCIRNWRSVYPSEQLLVLRLEDIAIDPVGVANRCLQHIDLPVHFQTGDHARIAHQVFEGDGVPIRPALRGALQAVYLPRIDSLARYLGQDLSSWGQTGTIRRP